MASRRTLKERLLEEADALLDRIEGSKLDDAACLDVLDEIAMWADSRAAAKRRAITRGAR